MQEAKQTILRSRLFTQDKPYASKDLLQDFLSMEEHASSTWIPALAHDKGSHSGSTHLKNVESLICNLLEQVPEIQLTPWEAYILLSAIIFHDIGRALSSSQKNRIEQASQSADEYIKEREEIHHAYQSYRFIKENDTKLGLIKDKGIVDCIARVCGAHDLKFAAYLRKSGKLHDIFLDKVGRIRIDWLGCLLSLGDELDNSYHRSMPDWVRSMPSADELKETFNQCTKQRMSCKEYPTESTPGDSASQPNEDSIRDCPAEAFLKCSEGNPKGRVRNLMYGCEVRREGRLLMVYPSEELREEIEKPSDEVDTDLLGKIWEDITNKQNLVQFWGRQLRQMHLELYTAAISVGGHLFGCKMEKGQFELIVEPVLRDMKVARVLDAAVQLRFNSFGKSTFPWETLAAEAGIERVSVAKLIFHRLAMLASYFFEEKGVNRPFHIATVDKSPEIPIKIIFTELDGEWSIHFESNAIDPRGNGTQPEAVKNKIDTAKKAVQMFHKWVSQIVMKSTDRMSYENDKIYQKDKDTTVHTYDRKLVIENPDLAYLFDEDGKHHKGIIFPKSQSILFGDTEKPNIGINLVISGPAGVGKSTLAMELIVRGRMWDVHKYDENKGSIGKAVSAYYSLEQPLESIRQLAIELDLKDDRIISFHPNPSTQNSFIHEIGYIHLYKEILERIPRDNGKESDPILLLPKLAPHSYGDSPDEEQLFWFRYKQVARLIEAHRAYQAQNDKDYSLGIIVLDNLNAFSHHPLARQHVHQLFRLIAWGGVLGVHIVEQNPSEKFRVFQTEIEALSDIVVHLDWQTQEYRYKTIEFVKSRCQKNVLGLHPFKIYRNVEEKKTNENGSSPQQDLFHGFTVFPSLHTQVVRNEKKEEDEMQNDIQKDEKGNDEGNNAKIGKNESLQQLVHKTDEVSGIAHDAFIVLSGRSGGHKLALGLDYLHGKRPNTVGLVLNMGQPIFYEAVAGYRSWYKENFKNKKELNKQWLQQKVIGDCYFQTRKKESSSEEENDSSNSISFLNPELDSIVVLNFQPGFLLPEEFINTVLTYIDICYKPLKIDRVLFNSTAHLSSRFPLLGKEPLMLTALVRILKKRGIGLMVIAVEETGHYERIESLASMADVKLNIHHLGDERVPPHVMEMLKKAITTEARHSARVISSDNVTGKDYRKNYGLLHIEGTADEPLLKIDTITKEIL